LLHNYTQAILYIDLDYKVDFKLISKLKVHKKVYYSQFSEFQFVTIAIFRILI